MTDNQKRKLSENSDYVKIVSSLQEIVQDELMNLVKDKILLRNDGKVLLDKQLNLIKILKDKIVEETNYEMELFKKFKEASINNPDLTYNEFYEAENCHCKVSDISHRPAMTVLPFAQHRKAVSS